VTVLSRDQIAAQQAESVSALLRQVPGLHIDQAGGRGSVSSVYLRGGDPNFTVVLIDGIKVNDPTNSRGGSFDFSTLSTDNIERLEIGRGPLSALYGSDAMSGAINIVTRRGGPQAVRSVDGTGGRFGYARTLVQAHGMLGVMDYALSGSYLDHGTPVEGSGLVNKTVHASLGLPISDAVDWRWVLRYADSRSTAFPDDSGGPRLAVRRDVEERQTHELTLGMALTHALDAWWEERFQIGIYNRQEGLHSPGVAPGVRDSIGIPPSIIDNTFWRYELTWQHRFLVAQGIRPALGVQTQFEEGASIGSLEVGGGLFPTSFKLSRTIWAPFLEVQLALWPGLLVQSGVRLDLPEGFDAALSPRLGASYTVAATQTTLRTSWGEGFKLPSFFAVGHPLVGNPDLVPETSQSVDAGITQVLWDRHIIVGVTYFYQTFTNLVDFAAGPPPRLVNRAEVTAAGVEMSVQVQPWSGLDGTAHLTYVKTAIRGTDEALRHRPTWRGGFTMRWRPLSGLDLYVQTLVVGEALDSSIPTGPRMLDAYTRVDLATTWTITSSWRVFLAVNNLFDADYEEFIGFPAPSISPRVGVQARF
jgi:iron complex outermembrane receptor protein/vitamin B12 transporter